MSLLCCLNRLSQSQLDSVTVAVWGYIVGVDVWGYIVTGGINYSGCGDGGAYRGLPKSDPLT